jgi:two-component system, LuxR family, sensor kinase FixL
MGVLKRIGVALAFSCLFVAVDRLSYIHPIGGLNITPWNPPAALEVLFLFLMGNTWMTWVYLTLGLSDWLVRGTLLLSPAVLLGNAVLVVCYASIALCLRWTLGRQAALRERREVLWLGLLIVTGALMTAVTYVGTQTWVGVLRTEDFFGAAHRFFIGDLLGLMVLLPLFFVARDKRRHSQYLAMFQSTLFWALVLGLWVCMWLIFSLPITDQMKYFFSLFFVLGLIAATYSLPGATLVAALIQVPLVFSTTHAGVQPADLMDMQIVMLSLSLTGLIIGTVVDERIRTEEQLRDSLQLVAAGELAGSLAHELHQPMSALSAYAESALMFSQTDERASVEAQSQLERLLRNIVNETMRATDIVRGLRSYFISGVSTLQNVDIKILVDECVMRMEKRAAQAQVNLLAVYEQHIHTVMVDRIQLSTAIGNLLKNAIDASEPGMSVRVRVTDDKHMLSIRVIDEAHLLDATEVEQVFRPFYSNKKDGLGLGLSVSQSLVENNGGVLRYQAQPYKCFEILLPLGDAADV